jgi:2-oxo-4-hydroxy-4-carboxy-5-ureidoimidazoline decarboxylase
MFASGMTATLTLDELNRMEPERFATALGHIFEHAPWVAARAASRRPFATQDALHRGMMDVVREATEGEQLALIHGHPELAGKAALDGTLTADSAREQGSAGLTRLTSGELSAFRALNAAYRARFGFPFIMAVADRTKDEIIAAIETRLRETPAAERAAALDQVGKIAAIRLAGVVGT